MNNILMDPLPTQWHGIRLNTDFRIGIQISQAMEDNSLNERERAYFITELLFRDKNMPIDGESVMQCLNFFLNDWNHDKSPEKKEKIRVVDYDVDQFRIYADFLTNYRIDLNKIRYMHWWAFCGLLWNLPQYSSSFLNAISIRKEKIDGNTPPAQRKVIKEAQTVYGLEQPEYSNFSEEDINKIDEFDKLILGK